MLRNYYFCWRIVGYSRIGDLSHGRLGWQNSSFVYCI